jgi:hypothetical protein
MPIATPSATIATILVFIYCTVVQYNLFYRYKISMLIAPLFAAIFMLL